MKNIVGLALGLLGSALSRHNAVELWSPRHTKGGGERNTIPLLGTGFILFFNKSLRVLRVTFVLSAITLSSCTITLEESVDVREPYLGAWTVAEEGTDDTYQVYLYKNRYSVDRVYIANFNGVSMEVEAVVRPAGLEIPRQFISGYEVSGYAFNTDSQALHMNFTFVEHCPTGDRVEHRDARMAPY